MEPAIFSLLCQTARPELAAAAQHSLPEALARLSEQDWEALIQQSLLHGTTGLLCDHLLHFGGPALSEDVAEACRAFIESCEALFAKGLDELRRVLDALEAAGVEAVPFKGPGLALRIYPNPRLRRFRDLDFLIRPEASEPALAVLATLGYRSGVEDLSPGRRRAYHHYNGQDILFAPDHFPIEPHWAFAPRTLSADIDIGALLDRAVTFKVPNGGEAPDGGKIRGMAPEDVLLAAALHGAKEEWARLFWVTDIAAIFAAWPALDAELVLHRATAHGCRRMLLLAVLLARDLTGATPPAMLVEQALDDPAVPGLAAEIRRRLPVSQGEAPSVFELTGFRWRVRERFADRMRYGVRTLLTARVPHFRTVPLPDSLAFAYPAVRIGRDALVLPLWKIWRRGQA